MQIKEQKEILKWCKETFGEYYCETECDYSRDCYAVRDYLQRDFRISWVHEVTIADFLLSQGTRSDVYFFFYPFDGFTFPNVVDETEDFFLSGLYSGQYIKFISVNLDHNSVYVNDIKIRYKVELEYMTRLVECSKERLEYFTKVTVQDAVDYYEEVRKKEEEVYRANRERIYEEMKTDRIKTLSGYIIYFSLLVFLAILLIMN